MPANAFQTDSPIADFLRTAFAPIPYSYCDFIADRIRRGLTTDDARMLLGDVSPVQHDLHPVHGSLASCTKTLTVTDKNGRTYRVTVEEAEAA